MKLRLPARALPRVEYHRYEGTAKAAFTRWFAVYRFWGGRVISITVKHHQLTFDFRENWLADLMAGTETGASQR